MLPNGPFCSTFCSTCRTETDKVVPVRRCLRDLAVRAIRQIYYGVVFWGCRSAVGRCLNGPTRSWNKEDRSMSGASTVQELNRELADKINEEARKNPQSPYANKFVGIANGQVVVVADSLREMVRRLRQIEPDPRKTFGVEASRDYDEVEEIWGAVLMPRVSWALRRGRAGRRLCPARPARRTD